MRRLTLAAILITSAIVGGVWARARTNTPSARLGSSAQCGVYSGLPPEWGASPTAGMVHVDGDEFVLGSMHGYADERPAGPVRVAGFFIDRTEVTNAQFAAFVEATGYVTGAEKSGGAVFRQPTRDTIGDEPWWHYERGANWRHPDGPPSDITNRGNEPVVQLTLEDASAYARWLGRRLPTEAEWELAARAGVAGAALDGAPATREGKPAANFWQGDFPIENLAQDGYAGRSPVGCFSSNGFGLYDMIGNVWEWTSDPYRGSHQAQGAPAPAEHEPVEPRVIKGGSYLCASNFCARHRATARHPQDASLSTAHVGFRTAKSD
ncbi:formylglycine-generating enzyme family protein [Pendulispora brunnea]|uniref:Formylglycine-generating enzyme family protein n=1 Tax=Pendulispora brunnea TaxID=2905690 RepID=A0ABZ2K604_9BACT